MPLQGTFDVLGFPDVLLLLSKKGATGRLHVRSRSIGANVYLDRGQLVGADVGDHSTNSATDVRSRLEEICFQLLEAERGTFEFVPDALGMGPVTVTLKVETLLARARRRIEDWREIQAIVPSLDLHPQIVTDIDRDSVTLSRSKWRLITAIDGRRSVRAISRSLSMSEFEVCRMLKGLLEDGVVEIVGPKPGMVASTTLSASIDKAVVDDDVVRIDASETPDISDTGDTETGDTETAKLSETADSETAKLSDTADSETAKLSETADSETASASERSEPTEGASPVDGTTVKIHGARPGQPSVMGRPAAVSPERPDGARRGRSGIVRIGRRPKPVEPA